MHRKSRIGIAIASTLAVVALGSLGGSVASGQDAVPSADSGSPAPDTRAVITSNLETTYVPVAPCRIVDSRLALGAIPAGGNRSYEVRGTTGFVPQGGKSGGCGIPTYATAVTFSISVVDPSGDGYLRGWPTGETIPVATVMNWSGGQSGTTTSPLTLGASSESKDIRFKAFNTAAMLVVDVQGFYAPQIHAELNGSGGLNSQTSRVLSSSRLAAGTYQVTVDRNVTGCSASAAPNGSGNFIASAVPGTGSTVTIYTYRADTAALTDITFNLDVSC